jgi:hypothetical protein
MKDFIVLDEQTFMQFINKNDPLENELSKHPPVKIKVGNNKIIIKYDECNHFISFKYTDMNMVTKYCELFLTIEQNTFCYLQMILMIFTIVTWRNGSIKMEALIAFLIYIKLNFLH